MLPEGWQSLVLGDVFSFKNGLNGEKSLYGAGAKFVNVMDVFRGPRLRHSEIVGEMAVSPRTTPMPPRTGRLRITPMWNCSETSPPPCAALTAR